ncbi:MAG: DUF1929 domain-containing protein [Methylococcales bacterium]|nr:DUF1929 domain-containing protein [Methylococcales bacterium]
MNKYLEQKPLIIILCSVAVGLFPVTAVQSEPIKKLEDDVDNAFVAPVIRSNRQKIILFQRKPTTQAYKKGMWSAVGGWPLFAIHMAVLPTGEVMTYGTDESGRGLGFAYDIWDPKKSLQSSAHLTLPVETNTNIFCSMQNLVGNGSLLITGGDQKPTAGSGGFGIREANLFDPMSLQMSLTAPMAHDRWYPSLTILPNGKALVQGGRIDKSTPAITPEIYNPITREFTLLNGASSASIYNQNTKGWYYPRAFVNSAGKLIFFTANQTNLFELNVNANNGTGAIKKLGSMGKNPFRYTLPAVNFAKDKVLTFREGGKNNIINIATFKKEPAANIQTQRIWSDATVLANGEIVVTGGAEVRQDLSTAVRIAQIYNPKLNTWKNAAKAKQARLYHSSAVLLPSGVILTAGGGPPGPVSQLNAEVYYPPYLFNRNGGWARRPVISGAPAFINYNMDILITVSHNRTISSVSMVRLGSTTHSFDQGQAYRNINFTKQGATITLSGKDLNSRSLTPGFYMIFALDDKGVPSEGHIVQLAH